MNLIVVSFEPDEGFMDSFLSIDNVSDEYFDGTKKFNYGSKYNTSAEIQITVIKRNGSDMKLNDFRACAKWLTGARIDSWLDLYAGEDIVYSFLGKFTNLEQYKLDARTVGLRLTFSSISPWAYSAPQTFNCSMQQTIETIQSGLLVKSEPESIYFSHVHDTLYVNDYGYHVSFEYSDNILSIGGWSDELDFNYSNDSLSIEDSTEHQYFGYENGILFPNHLDSTSCFSINSDGVIYIDDLSNITIDNQTDDLYTYIYLDIDYENETGNFLSINNITLNEETKIYNIVHNESISISSKQFIASDIPNKIFGDSFNFIWPRLQPGINEFLVECGGNGIIKFTYRYPMKVGDCTMDIDVYGSGIDCGSCPDNDGSGNMFTGTIAWKDITNTPTTIAGYGITDAYTMNDVDNIVENIEISSGGGDVSINETDLNEMLSNILQ